MNGLKLLISNFTTDVDETVYNITVENTHTYLVEGIVVHNK